MVVLQDVRTAMGTLLVPSGFEVTPAFLERLRHFGPDILNETVAVIETANYNSPPQGVAQASENVITAL